MIKVCVVKVLLTKFELKILKITIQSVYFFYLFINNYRVVKNDGNKKVVKITHYTDFRNRRAK